ncbi:hypothetical protein AYL99_01751 [Fonsecaea erecta]|uniref:Uncharacterized protein n=1 Tax=Fonsecaea erecta TaxID=1367422 RepID=A0A179A164_9EURO|nr:hypothetical protein AYL99_01751 [Fonsecaea erecta]OAP65779.1 hypothetical protein AYL99_01751 [Fonsecaea erecta]
MLALQRSGNLQDKCVVNILPCRIHHNGPTKVTKRYWSPLVEKGASLSLGLPLAKTLIFGLLDGTVTSYFRGRRLRGKPVKVPAGYRGKDVHSIFFKEADVDMLAGVVVKTTDRFLPQPCRTQTGPTYTVLDEDIEIADEEDEDEPPEPVKTLEELSTFEEVIVWGHDAVPTTENAFVKGIEEWIAFAEAIHGTPTKLTQSEKEKDDRDT